MVGFSGYFKPLDGKRLEQKVGCWEPVSVSDNMPLSRDKGPALPLAQSVSELASLAHWAGARDDK